MRPITLLPLLLGLALILPGVMPSSMLKPQDIKVILVDLNVKTPADASKCYSNLFDRKRVEISLDIDDPLNTLEDFAMYEDPLDGPGCFMPELKVIFQDYTYIFSIYCTSVKMYRNSSPYLPSAKTMACEVEMTESVIELLEKTRKKYFGTKMDPIVAAKFNKPAKLESLDIDDSQLYKDDDDDKDIEKDAIDKEGWFDKLKDPGIYDDETPEDDDGGR